ncbi:MAG TPA: alkaline phosphatase D family protein [Chryseosolibacter sp.]
MKLLMVVAMIGLGLLLSGCQVPKESSARKALVEEVAPLYDSALRPFYHGVASGDPLQDRVILWTRVTPSDAVASVPVRWEISTDQNFSSILQSDTLSTSPTNDYTVKVDVTELAAGTKYFYRFVALGKTSMVGETKTLPQQSPEHVKFAVVSCANWEFGYFNAYARIAEKDLDAVIHLGDYIYEYATGKYGNKNSDRKNLPSHEIVTLKDYRTRYSQYHLDAGLRQARQRHPFITIWDDHEVANDVYTEGAQNHQPEEGDFMTRKQAATKAYYEWMPIREGNRLYRSFSYGDMCDLIMLDERLEGRVKPLDSLKDPAYTKEYRTMLGQQQLDWFQTELKKGTSWKIIGNQVMFAPLDQSAINPNQGVNLDSWGGYPLERNKISDFLQSNAIKDVVFLTGDTHASWACEVVNDVRTSSNKNIQNPFAVELGTTSISSGNANEYAADSEVMQREKKLLTTNPHFKYANQRDHGYLLLTVTKDKSTAEWYVVDTLLKIDSAEHLDKSFNIHRGKSKLLP